MRARGLKEMDVAALVRCHLNGLQPLESKIEQTNETIPPSHKTITAAAMRTNRITSLRALLHYRWKSEFRPREWLVLSLKIRRISNHFRWEVVPQSKIPRYIVREKKNINDVDDLPCIRLAHLKLELTNQNSAGGRKLYSPAFNVSCKHWSRATFHAGNGIKYWGKGIYNSRNGRQATRT